MASSPENTTTMADNSILSESPVKHIEWSIHNFSDQPTDDYILDSASFSLCDVKWFIRICPNGEKRTNSSGWISLYLVRKKSLAEHRVSFKIGLKKTDRSEYKTVEYEHTFEKSMESGWGNPKVIDRPTLLNPKGDVVLDGTLTVFCTCRLTDRLISTTVESASQTPSDGTSTLIRDLKDLCLNNHQADLTITVKDKEFRCHKSILSCRSSVFKSMLLNNMTEKNSGSVKISDGDPHTFQDFLLFVYTGKFDNVSSGNAVSLYRCADKYDVQELKDECVRCMLEELSDDIFCDVLYLATLQNEEGLLKAVTHYFIKNAKTITVSPQWCTFIEEHPLVGNELYIKLLNSKKKMNN